MDTLTALVKEMELLNARYVRLCERKNRGERVSPELQQTIAALDVVSVIAIYLRRKADEANRRAALDFRVMSVNARLEAGDGSMTDP